MKHGVRRFVTVILMGMCAAASAAEKSDEDPASRQFSSSNLFQEGRFEAAVSSGVLFSPFIATANRPVIDYTISELQLGYMLGDASQAGVLRGNFEVLGEGFGNAIFKGPGDYIAGATFWVRYNFVHSRSRLVPFVQAGAGLTSTDIDHHIVGEDFNFNLDMGFGARYLISRNLSVNLEYRYQHISNANIAPKNLGINADGPVLGVSWFF